MISFEVPIKTVNELNRPRAEFWASKNKRVANQRRAVYLLWPRTEKAPPPPLKVKLTRIAPSGGLDEGDGLSASMKAVRDEVACCLGFVKLDKKGRPIAMDGPGSPIRFEYAQERGKYAVRIEVEADHG